MNDSQKDVDLSEGMAPSKIVGLFLFIIWLQGIILLLLLDVQTTK